STASCRSWRTATATASSSRSWRIPRATLRPSNPRPEAKRLSRMSSERSARHRKAARSVLDSRVTAKGSLFEAWGPACGRVFRGPRHPVIGPEPARSSEIPPDLAHREIIEMTNDYCVAPPLTRIDADRREFCDQKTVQKVGQTVGYFILSTP